MTNMHHILIIDDEPDICELLTITLNRMSLETDTASNYQEATEKLQSRHYDLCLTDMRLPDGNGLDLVDLIQQQYSDMPVAVISAHGNMEAAIRALKAGAFDFISKPIDVTKLRNLISSALKLSHTSPDTDKKEEPGNPLLGNSNIMQQLRKTIEKLARSQAPVYIHGESGTGKELVAQLIHQQGPRKDKAFVPVNCSAIPSELMESEFFGHRKGSFTGATQDKEGLFAAADGGTLFLDEVADLPLNMQVKLLRAIQERVIRPIGSTNEIPVDIRILSASHQDLDPLVESKQFRQDLYYRINVIRLDIPRLAERQEDIIELAHYYLQIISEQQQQTFTLDDSARNALLQYHFPGNVRELENILQRAATLCEMSTISTDDLQLLAQAPSPELATASTTTSSHSSNTRSSDPQDLDHMLQDQERETIVAALEKTHWNKTKAAKLLGITFRRLRYRIKKLDIE